MGLSSWNTLFWYQVDLDALFMSRFYMGCLGLGKYL